LENRIYFRESVHFSDSIRLSTAFQESHDDFLEFSVSYSCLLQLRFIFYLFFSNAIYIFQFNVAKIISLSVFFLRQKNSCLHRCKALSSNLPESVKPSHSKESTQKNNLFVNHKLEELSRPRLTRCALQSCQPPDRRLTCTPDTVNAPKTQASLRSPVSKTAAVRERERSTLPACCSRLKRA